MALLPRGLLAVVYGLTLFYLFMGVSIVADIFMVGIEKITSLKTIVHERDEKGQVVRSRKVLVWNATVANLTLMALGSSSPEILLAIIETVKDLGECPGELGAPCIVGSAAYNLLMISAVSIWAVSPETDTDRDKEPRMRGIKKINDVGVFAVTTFYSLLSYVWLWIVLLDQTVTIAEAAITVALFFVLILVAWAADRCNSARAA